MKPKTAVGVAVPIVFIVFCGLLVILVLVYTYTIKPVRASPSTLLRHESSDAVPREGTCRFRFVNIQLLPIPYFISAPRKAKKLNASGLFADVDVVFMQEAFSRVFIDKTDILTHLQQSSRKPLQLAATEAALPKGYFTDCGLAAAACSPWTVKYVASKGFACGTLPCALAYKGVTIFEVSSSSVRPFRIANTHLQALSSHNSIQHRQFAEAVKFAVLHDALLIGGDMNVTEVTHVLAMTETVRAITAGKSAFVVHDGTPTCCKRKSGRHAYMTEARFDHVWILDTNKISCSRGIVTRDDLTDGISDHACIELTLTII